MPTNPTHTVIELELERIRTDAQRDAFFYDDVNDACPYPFRTVEGATYKDAFFKAQAALAQAIAADTQATHAIPRI
jgi:hypothetical protein